MKRPLIAFIVSIGLAAGLFAQGRGPAPGQRGRGGQARPARKQLLVWCDATGGGLYHDSVSHAMSVIERMGRETGLYDAYLRTDSQLITKQKTTVRADGRDWPVTKTLDYFDGIFFCGLREIPLTDQQFADLMAFVHDDGKGFVAAHAADTAFVSRPEFAKMLGSSFDNHPWGQVQATIINEAPDFPATAMFPRTFTFTDEMYQVKDFSRAESRVLLRVDPASVDMTNPNVHRTDGDFPVAWVKPYGKGRVFVCAFGHAVETWDDPNIQKMWLEAIKWSLGLTDGDIAPRPLK